MYVFHIMIIFLAFHFCRFTLW